MLEGYRVLEAGDRRAGVGLLRESRPDLVFLDMIMPEKNGIETLREILGIDPGAKVITFSGRSGAAVHNETAEMLGAVASFRKPFVLAELITTIRRLIPERNLD